MTLAPTPLLELLGGSRLVLTRDAVKATLAKLLPGVTVVSHPGKIDINDVVQKTIVQAPGVAVGYTRLRQAADPAGTWSDVVDFVAYIVVDDLPDRGPPVRTHPREIVAHAIGGRILQVLRHPTLMFWGLKGVEAPSQDPGPNLTPVFTMKAEQNMTAVYAVTWSQALANDGEPFFGGGPFTAERDDGFPDSAALVFDVGDEAFDDLPPELQAHLRRSDWDKS